MYLSSVEGPKRRGRPLGRWEDRVKEDVRENEGKWVGVGKKGVREQGELEIRLPWPPPWGPFPEGGEASELLID